jgi:hypothetical protein
LATTRRIPRRRLRLRRGSSRRISDLLGPSAVTGPTPVRPEGAPVYVLPPGTSRYQRRSAKLPSGVSRFAGLEGDGDGALRGDA